MRPRTNESNSIGSRIPLNNCSRGTPVRLPEFRIGTTIQRDYGRQSSFNEILDDIHSTYYISTFTTSWNNSQSPDFNNHVSFHHPPSMYSRTLQKISTTKCISPLHSTKSFEIYWRIVRHPESASKWLEHIWLFSIPHLPGDSSRSSSKKRCVCMK